MRRLCYQFCAGRPIDYDLVRDQIRAGHDYQNVLIEIERGRRQAMRQLYDEPEVRAAEEALKDATKSDRKARRAELYALRRSVLEQKRDAAKTINDLAHELQRGARALTSCFWGTYLEIEARMQASRAMPLYEDDGLKPADPRFRRWRERPMIGQIGVQIQSTRPLKAADVYACTDSRVRIERREGGKWGTLFMRIGSKDGTREPLWVRIGALKLQREIPDAALWKWVRVSVRPGADGTRERWTCEITVDDPSPRPRDLDKDLSGSIAVSWSWDKLADDSVRVASWRNSSGATGEVIVPADLVTCLHKCDGIRAVRDTVWNHTMPRLAQTIKTSKGTLPKWLSDAANTMHLWRSLKRVHALGTRWRQEGFDGARAAYDILDVWEFGERNVVRRKGTWNGDWHLRDYETGSRQKALNTRRDLYRQLAARWAKCYKHVLLSNHRLDREAQFGPDSDVRFTVAPDQLRGALKNAFGDDSVEVRWDREPEWCERALAAFETGTARDALIVEKKEKTSNAWASRKKKKAEAMTTRNTDGNPAEAG